MSIKCPYFLEIKNVVFNLNGNSAPSLDGFDGDVCNVVQQFFKKN